MEYQNRSSVNFSQQKQLNCLKNENKNKFIFKNLENPLNTLINKIKTTEIINFIKQQKFLKQINLFFIADFLKIIKLMEIVDAKFNQFKAQCHSENDIPKVQDLNKQIFRLQQFKQSNFNQRLPFNKQEIQKLIKVYKLASKQIQRMKMQFTKPSLVKQRLIQIFDNKREEMSLTAAMQKSSEIRTSQVQLPTFKKVDRKQKVISVEAQNNQLHSPALSDFFQKKKSQIINRSNGSNFKSILNVHQSSKSNSRSMSREQPSHVSSASFRKKTTPEMQLKKLIEQNKKIKQQYERKIKRQLQLSQFQKNLLKEQKSRYMLKIQQLETQMENLYRDNYRLKQQEVVFKQKEKRSKLAFDNSASFRDLDQNVHKHLGSTADYYQPYVMRTKNNDLKKLNMKCQSQFDQQSLQNKSINNFFAPPPPDIAQSPVDSPVFAFKSINRQQKGQQDFLGNELQKQLKQMQKQRSKQNHSLHSSKKWSKQYNKDIHESNKFKRNFQQDDLLKVLRDDDEEDNRMKRQIQNNTPFRSQNSNNYIQMTSKNPFQSKQDNLVLKDLDFSLEMNPVSKPSFPVNKPQYGPPASQSRVSQQQISYKPQSNYSFTHTANKDYSINSNVNNFDTFEMTRTYLNFSQNQQESLTNKYIDSKTSTRNKVGFFKDSLILIKNEIFQLAFKRSALVPTKDRVRIIYFIKNKTSQHLNASLRYEYDAGYFKIKVNQKLERVAPNGQGKQDLEIYAYSTHDLNEVIDVLVEVNSEKYGLWMPTLWIQLSENDNFKMPNYSQQITIVPDRQFKSYQMAKHLMPLVYGGNDGLTQWAYLYGVCKYGPCFVKLVWQDKELKIQTNAKWIDLLAFVMHHVK